MTFNRLVVDRSLYPPFVVMVGYVRAKASVHPCISDVAIMHDVVKGGVFDFIGHNTQEELDGVV